MKVCTKSVASIKKALSLSYVTVFLVFFAVVGTIMFYISEKMVTDSTRQLAHQEVEEVQQVLNTYLSEVKTLAASLIYNPNVLEYVTNADASEVALTDWEKQLKGVVTSFLMKERGMHSIGIFPKTVAGAEAEAEGLYFGDTSMQSVYQTAKMYPQYDLLEKTGEECIWVPSFPLKYSSHCLIALQYRIVDVKNFKEIGVLTMNLKTLYLSNLLSRYGMAGYLYLVNEKGEIVAKNKSGEIPVEEVVGELSQGENDDLVRIFGGEKCIVSYDTLPVTGWKMVGLIPIRELQKNIRHGQAFMLLSMLFGAIVVIGLSLIISAKISKPIATLTEGMKAIQNNDLSIRIHDNTFLETKRLSEGFNEMLDDINELLIKTYQQELMERDIRLEALQAKISPHFLYNTLETINALLILKENYETSQMVSSLADLLRYSISPANRIMTIEEELKYIQKYLYIYKVRFGEQFEYSIEIEAAVASCKTLKMLIQPIVENAAIHGIENKIGKGILQIHAYEEGGRVLIRVRDNGIGMSAEKIVELLTVEESKTVQTECRIGLRNVLSRIRLHYGADYGLAIQSIVGEGTSVTIVLPKETEGEYD